ncbi:MAG TPA: ATP-binding protein [Chloroflexi bacterium]|nr:ATP-binding protein [Chloroflexota bacterium]HHW86999.1 ABC transporter ATP-binding protein [Chloroflexota bacterium]
MIEVEQLTFTYTGATQPAIRNLTFAIAPGEVFGFLGPSGAGKSTTQRILIGLLRGYQGCVTVMGRDLKAWGVDYYQHVGVTFELPNYFTRLTALENLTYFGALYQRQGAAPRALLEMVGLGDSADLQVAHFSKGMKNRLGIARALLHDPDLLFMDEPTSGLDPVNARMVKALIKAQQQAGKTIFLTTHNMTVADELCDRVAFLVDGEIRLMEAPRQLKLRYGRPAVRIDVGNNDNGVTRREFPLAELGANAEFLALLQQGHLETIHTQEATLEDIFVQVTGRTL